MRRFLYLTTALVALAGAAWAQSLNGGSLVPPPPAGGTTAVDGTTISNSAGHLSVITATPSPETPPALGSLIILDLNTGNTITGTQLQTLLNFIAATGATTPASVPNSGIVGTPVAGGTTTLSPSGATAYASLSQGGTEQSGSRTSFTGTSIPSLTPSSPSASTTINIYAAPTGGSPLATSANISVTQPATGATLAGFPTTSTQGVALNLTGATATLTPSGSTGFAVLNTGGSDEGSRVSFTGTTPPGETPQNSGTYTYKVYAAATGGTALATSPSITVAAGTITMASVAIGANGTTVTFTGSATYTCTAADFTMTKNGSADALTNSDCGTSATAHVFTAASAFLGADTGLYSITPVGATTPNLTATYSGATATNNSTGGQVGPNLTMSSATYDTSTPKFGSGALSGGYGTATVTWTPGNSAIGVWFKASTAPPTNDALLVASSTGYDGVGVRGGGTCIPYGIQGSYARSSTGGSVCDGNWHYLEVDQNSSGNSGSTPPGFGVYVDGVQAGLDNYAAHAVNPTIYVGAGSSSGVIPGTSTQLGWGEIDSPTIYNTTQHSAAFTNPSSAPTSASSGLVAGWPLNSNGNGL